ncbi:MAG: hypothetical protein C3F14_00505 [Deltaproteobacteria bacterium]|nr:MAG: hypothetical protein C3F14_00505 [Deltaproteobacteria bacterium]
MALFAISAVLAACGGGGAGSSSTGAGTGTAAVGVSMTASADYPAGTTFGSPAGTLAMSAPPATTTFDNVWVTVTKLALLRTSGPEFPDPSGEIEAMDAPEDQGMSGNSGFVVIELPSPVVIDLLHPPTDRQVAKILNKFGDVPAGEYSKIRVYYSKVEGQVSGGALTPFHPTAHYHFDVHFVGGNLVVPVATDPDGGIRFFSISIGVVGLKIQQAGNSGNFLLRPQVFATVKSPGYLVSGEARNVNPADKTFDILTTGGTTLSAAYDGDTEWVYLDPSIPRSSSLTVAGVPLGARGLENTAIVDVIGTFSAGKILQADEVDVTFPTTLTGKVYLGWIPPDNTTFALRLPADNVVIPLPTRQTAYYDNAVGPAYAPLTDLSIVDNVFVVARGYATTEGIRSYWITVGFGKPLQ